VPCPGVRRRQTYAVPLAERPQVVFDRLRDRRRPEATAPYSLVGLVRSDQVGTLARRVLDVRRMRRGCCFWFGLVLDRFCGGREFGFHVLALPPFAG
jgi:hypothetical protein